MKDLKQRSDMMKFLFKRKNHSGIARESKSERGRINGREISKVLMEKILENLN